MNRVKHIATIVLLTALMLLAGVRYAFAQNTSALPYLSSWHKYRVPMGAVANTPTWQLQINGASEISLSNNMNEAGDGEIWVKYDTENDAGTHYAYILIKFIDPRFDLLDVATIIYSEMDVAGGGCVAKRSTNAIVQPNVLNLSINDTGDACNSYSGAEWDNSDGDLSIPDYITTVEFEVKLNKPLNLSASAWQFSGTVSITSGVDNALTLPDITIGGSTNTLLNADNDATWSATVSGASFTIDVSVATPTFAYTDDVVTFTVSVNGKITSDYGIRLQLDDGYIVTGSGYGSETDDNESGSPRVLTRTIFGIPNTSIITVNP